MNDEQFFSSEGRIGGGTLLLRTIIALVAQALTVAVCVYLLDLAHLSPFHEDHAFLMPLFYFFVIVTGIFVLFTVMMQLIKRLHDMGKGPMFAALTFVPGVNVLFLIYAILAPAKKD